MALISAMAAPVPWTNSAEQKSGATSPITLHARELLATVHANYGHALDAMESFELAAVQYRASLALQPSVTTLNKLGSCLTSQKKIDEAIEQFQAALAMAPTEPAVHYNLAAAHAAQGEIDEALRHAQTALLHNENFEQAKQMVDILKKHQKKAGK